MAVTNLDRWRARVMAMGSAAVSELQSTVDKNAQEFADKVHSTVPKDSGGLETTIQVSHGPKPISAKVTIGDEAHDYAGALEFGHNDKGKHVAPKPYFFTSLRVLRTKFRRRLQRAFKTALKSQCLQATPDAGGE